MRLRGLIAMWSLLGCAGSDDASSRRPPVDAPPANVTLESPPVTLAPGEESTTCVRQELGNDAPLYVRAIHTDQSPLGHHLTLFRTSDTRAQSTPEPCSTSSYEPFLAGDRAPLFASQVEHDAVVFPDGTGLRIEPHQMLEVEVHMLNSRAGSEQAFGRVGLTTVPADAGMVGVDMHQYLITDFSVAPGTLSHVGPAFIPIHDQRKVVAVAAHTHSLGLDVQVWKANAQGTTDGDLYPHDRYDWSSPQFAQLDPPVAFGAGEGVQFECDYYNDRPDPVRFGLNTRDEMCLVWVFTTGSPYPETCLVGADGQPNCFEQGACGADSFCGGE